MPISVPPVVVPPVDEKIYNEAWFTSLQLYAPSAGGKIKLTYTIRKMGDVDGRKEFAPGVQGTVNIDDLASQGAGVFWIRFVAFLQQAVSYAESEGAI